MATISDYYAIKAPAKIAGRCLKRSIITGIEIELEEVEIKRPVAPWKLVEDGSLKINGREFTLPVWNTSAKEFLEHLFSALQTKESSDRCSVHIHLNILDMTIEQIRTLIACYIIFERALFKYSGNRWNSNFCVPVQTYIQRKIHGIDMGILEQTFPKYSALHFLPDRKLGTVEFRHMVGNTNIDYITNWINILSELLTYSKTKDFEELKQEVMTMRTESSYWDLGKNIFKETFSSLQYKDFQKDAEKGVLITKLLLV